MSIAEQFAGLQMDQLIGGPLSAAADASTLLANSTADFINRVGFDATGKIRTAAFMYQKRSINEDGSSNLDEMKIDVPMLAIVPIPNLQIDEVNILFDMEVKQSEREEKSLDLGASITGSLGIGPFKVSVTGNVSAHQSNTRSSDNSAKYHVDVRATNHGTPEGLARVLDMMAANVAPSLVSSTLKDGNGQNLSEAARIKAERLKALRCDISQIESRINAAKEGLDNSIKQLKSVADTQRNAYQAAMLQALSSLDKNKEEDNKKAEEWTQVMDAVNQSWSAFMNQVPELIKMVSDSDNKEQNVIQLCELKGINKDEKKVVDYGEKESYYSALLNAQSTAITAQKNFSGIEKQLFEKKQEYSDAIAGKAAPAALPVGKTE